ncbi:MAG: ribosome assembly RNA-binding protein YhbY [Gammaproteobacteria bacterium]
MTLTEKQKKHLRQLAHDMKPLVLVGSAGASAGVLQELNNTLEHHELVKIKIRIGERDARDSAIAELVTASGAELVRTIGNTAVLYRPSKNKPTIQLP